MAGRRNVLQATYRSLVRLAQSRSLVTAQPAPAQGANAIVVTAATAACYHLRSIASLGRRRSAENITPLVRQPTVERYGPRLLDAVSARLSTSTLRGLDGWVELARLPVRSVADDWLRAQALIPPRRGGQ